MGFSIGRFLGSIAGPLVAGGATAAGFPGLGLVLGGGIAEGFNEPARAATIGRQTQPGPIFPTFDRQFQGGPTFLPTQVGPQAGLGISPIIRGIGAIGTGVGISQFFGNGNGKKTQLQLILAKARAATGGPVTRNKIIDAAKVCGLETAASTFGLTVNDVCMVVVKGRTRRRRGVSAADIRRTKRTIGFASRIRKDLKALAR